MAAEVKKRMDECVAHRDVMVAHWHRGMESRKRSWSEGQERQRMTGGKVFSEMSLTRKKW